MHVGRLFTNLIKLILSQTSLSLCMWKYYVDRAAFLPDVLQTKIQEFKVTKFLPKLVRDETNAHLSQVLI